MNQFLFGALVNAGAGIAIFAGLRMYAAHMERKLAEAATWPSVMGRITRARLKKPSPLRGYVEQQLVVPDLAYTYEVNGEAYKSNKIQFGAWSSGRMGAESFIERHGVGSETTVLYDPANPKLAILRASGAFKSYRRGAWIVLALCALLAVAQVYVSTLPPPPGAPASIAP